MKKKKFSKFRELNRQRNYMMKQLRMNIACLFLDKKNKAPFPATAINRILLLRDDNKIGDMVVSTSLIRELSRAGYIIDVLAGPVNQWIIAHNPHISQIIITPEEVKTNKTIGVQLADNHYDLIIDMGDQISPGHLRFLQQTRVKNVVGFNKEKYKRYNLSLSYHGYDQHITTRYKLLMQALNLPDFSTDYELYIPTDVVTGVNHFFNSLAGNVKIVINPFTADQRRDLSGHQLNTLISMLKALIPESDIILIGSPDRMNSLDIKNATINPLNSLISAAEIIHQADIVISPDTAIVHLAAVWKKPLVSLYGNDMHGEFINSKVWAPGYLQAIQLITKDKYHPVSSIPCEEIVNAVKQLHVL